MVKCSHLCKFIGVVQVGCVLSQDRVEFAHCPFRMSQAYDLFSLCRAPGSIILLPASTSGGSSPRSSCPQSRPQPLSSHAACSHVQLHAEAAVKQE